MSKTELPNMITSPPRLTSERADKLADYLEALPRCETANFVDQWWTEEGNP